MKLLGVLVSIDEDEKDESAKAAQFFVIVALVAAFLVIGTIVDAADVAIDVLMRYHWFAVIWPPIANFPGTVYTFINHGLDALLNWLAALPFKAWADGDTHWANLVAMLEFWCGLGLVAAWACSVGFSSISWPHWSKFLYIAVAALMIIKFASWEDKLACPTPDTLFLGECWRMPDTPGWLKAVWQVGWALSGLSVFIALGLQLEGKEARGYKAELWEKVIGGLFSRFVGEKKPGKKPSDFGDAPPTTEEERRSGGLL